MFSASNETISMERERETKDTKGIFTQKSKYKQCHAKQTNYNKTKPTVHIKYNIEKAKY